MLPRLLCSLDPVKRQIRIGKAQEKSKRAVSPTGGAESKTKLSFRFLLLNFE